MSRQPFGSFLRNGKAPRIFRYMTISLTQQRLVDATDAEKRLSLLSAV